MPPARPCLTQHTRRRHGRVAGMISLLLSALSALAADPGLVSLTVEGAGLSPAFNTLTGNYSASVANSVSTVTVTATAAGEGSTIAINGVDGAAGTASQPVPLEVGPNLITALVRAQDGVATRTYTVNVNRASAAIVSTAAAAVTDSSRATLNGSVNPNGASTVYFEYGTTPEFGSRTPDQDFSGVGARDFAASLTGLAGATTYHFRAVLFNGAGIITGSTLTMTTPPNPPAVATGAPVNLTPTSATMIGAVNPNGVQASVYFEYGLTTAYGQSTPVRTIPAGSGVVAVQAPGVPLIPNATYHHRLVASNGTGTTFGSNVTFMAQAGGGPGSGAPTAAPEVATGEPAGIETGSAILQGIVNPNGGTTLARFEYGLTPEYGIATPEQGVGNGDSGASVAIPVQGLLPGTTYHFRLSASNSLGGSSGEDATFTTAFAPPSAATGGSTVLTANSVRIEGSVRARGTHAEVWIDYGTDGISFSSVTGSPALVSGDQSTAVSAELTGLAQGVTYFYRVRATGPGGEGVGLTRSFDVASLSGLIRQFPAILPAADRQGSVVVTLDPVVPGAGWRFGGEQFWRGSGVPATGLASGDRVIEYRPVPGFVQPINEAVAVASNAPPTALTRTYAPSAETGEGTLVVIIKPQDLSGNPGPARWRFSGEGDDDWRTSGDPVTGLVPGSYVIESRPVAGRSTPAPVIAVVGNGEITTITITYYLAEEDLGTPPSPVTFESLSADDSLPYAFVGQIRGDAGSGSGFVVRPRVVATVGHVIFDDGTLAVATGLQWLFQHDRGVHDPVPQTPRGHYLMTGYAAQRAADDSPGVSSPESQNLDAATMFFVQDVSRGGFSGYLASDAQINEYLVSDSPMTLVGYPIDGIPDPDRDRMHATPPGPLAFTKAFGGTYTTPDIRASGGASGGPLCVMSANGAYYPAAIYLGGTGQTVVRALDGEVVGLISLAEAASGDGVGVTGGSQSEPVTGDSGNPELGALNVVIEPASARAAGAGWRLGPLSAYQPSGEQLAELDPGPYTITFPVLKGFVPPASQSVTVGAGVLTTLTFNYEPIVAPPSITSEGAVSGVRGAPLSHQVAADNSPALFSLIGVLPAGLGFDPATGLISGIPAEAGVFRVTVGASNSGGAASRELAITTLPVLESQTVTVPVLAPMNHPLVSSESGAGVIWTSGGLPAGLGFNSGTGVISGIPQVTGVFEIPMTVSKLGATAQSTFTLTVTGDPPVFTLHPPATPSIQYGTSATLAVETSGVPEPRIQWYEGPVGNTDTPVPGATSPIFITPPLTAETTYWARAASISGVADSTASVISVPPSSNANLAELGGSFGQLTPGFDPDIKEYQLTVPNEIPAVRITGIPELEGAAVRIGGFLAPQGSAYVAILGLETKLVEVQVTAADGISVNQYTVLIVRTPPPLVATGNASEVTPDTADLRGTATPNGPATVFFQYGATISYGATSPRQDVSGASELEIEAPVFGLTPNTTYHYRLGLTSGTRTIFGANMTFTTGIAPPWIATGFASDSGASSVKLIGAVKANGSATSAYFEYGQTPLYGQSTPVQLFAADSGVIDMEFTLEGLVPDGTYHYRLVGTNAAGTVFGEDVTFVVGQANGGSGTPGGAPEVSTLTALELTKESAVVRGNCNPNGGTTFVRFEYGPTTAYGKSTAARGIGSGSEPALVIRQVAGLLPGTNYHYRLVATNSLGTSVGEDASFRTVFSDPLVTTGDASPLTANSARVNGTVRARGATVELFFEYGTDGVGFPNRVAAAGGTAGGDAPVSFAADLTALLPGVTYYYRALAINPSDPDSTGAGATKSFQSDALLGLVQKHPRALDPSEYQGELQVNLIPGGIGKWRLLGDTEWRESGAPASGMATGDREIEFLPVAGYLQPAREPVGVISGAPGLVLEREYFPSASPDDSGLQIILHPGPADVADAGAFDGQWRLSGDADPVWRDSGGLITSLTPGSYLVEFKETEGRDAPVPATVVLAAGEVRTASFVYSRKLEVSPSSIQTFSFEELSTTRNLPHAYVGQILSDAGSHSGFVVKPRVVATTAQAVFDEVTLAQIPGVQWLFQRDREVHEPKPQIPRGFYAFGDYAAQRRSENTPGSLSITAQGLNAAALYFAGDSGRGGFAGFMTTNALASPLLDSNALMTLSGYPGKGGDGSSFGRLHATVPATGVMTPMSPAVFGSQDIKGLNGMGGGPISIQHDGGGFLPVGIYLGGSASGDLYRVIDGALVDLFNRGEVTANTGDNNTSGGISQTSYTAVSTTSTRGSLTVLIEPAEARSAGAAWNLGSDSGLLLSGSRKNNLTPGDYTLVLKPLAGFQAPSQVVAKVVSNNLTTVTFTYLPALSELASWREQRFGSFQNLGVGSDSEDPDGDGWSNLDEYLAGTDPNDGRDFFRVKSAALSGRSFSVVVPGRAGRTYTLQRGADPATGDWLDVTTVGPLAADEDLVLTDPDAETGKGFYRVDVTAEGL